jgi:hypothetical protein
MRIKASHILDLGTGGENTDGVSWTILLPDLKLYKNRFLEELIDHPLSIDKTQTSNNSIVVCVFFEAVTFFTEPLPSKDRVIHI